MTLGEKIKEARMSAGITQEQLAEKLAVSRQAVTKWEACKGIPDIENLKLISKLLNVSIDYLLDDGNKAKKSVIREAIDLSKYGKERKKVKKDKAVREKFPDASISTLTGRQKSTKSEKIIDNALGFLTDAPFGIPQFINDVKNMDKEFYLAETGDRQYLITVTDEFIESMEISNKVPNQRNARFEADGFLFINCGPIKYA